MVIFQSWNRMVAQIRKTWFLFYNFLNTLPNNARREVSKETSQFAFGSGIPETPPLQKERTSGLEMNKSEKLRINISGS